MTENKAPKGPKCLIQKNKKAMAARVSYQPRSRGWHWYLAPVKTLVNMPDMPAYQMPSPYMPLGTWHLAFGTMVPHIGTWYQLPMTSESVPNWCQPCQRCQMQMPDARCQGTTSIPSPFWYGGTAKKSKGSAGIAWHYCQLAMPTVSGMVLIPSGARAYLLSQA